MRRDDFLADIPKVFLTSSLITDEYLEVEFTIRDYILDSGELSWILDGDIEDVLQMRIALFVNNKEDYDFLLQFDDLEETRKFMSRKPQRSNLRFHVLPLSRRSLIENYKASQEERVGEDGVPFFEFILKKRFSFHRIRDIEFLNISFDTSINYDILGLKIGEKIPEDLKDEIVFDIERNTFLEKGELAPPRGYFIYDEGDNTGKVYEGSLVVRDDLVYSTDGLLLNFVKDSAVVIDVRTKEERRTENVMALPDLRVTSIVENPEILHGNIFGDLYLSRSKENNLHLGFFVDIERLLFIELSGGRFFSLLGRETREAIVKRFFKPNLTIKRRKVESTRSLNSVCVSVDRFRLSATDPQISIIEDVIGNFPLEPFESKGKRFYYGVDKEVQNLSRGQYEYSIMVEFLDPFLGWLSERITILSSIISSLRRFQNRTDNTREYDIASDSFRKAFLAEQRKRGRNPRETVFSEAKVISFSLSSLVNSLDTLVGVPSFIRDPGVLRTLLDPVRTNEDIISRVLAVSGSILDVLIDIVGGAYKTDTKDFDFQASDGSKPTRILSRSHTWARTYDNTVFDKSIGNDDTFDTVDGFPVLESVTLPGVLGRFKTPSTIGSGDVLSDIIKVNSEKTYSLLKENALDKTLTSQFSLGSGIVVDAIKKEDLQKRGLVFSTDRNEVSSSQEVEQTSPKLKTDIVNSFFDPKIKNSKVLDVPDETVSLLEGFKLPEEDEALSSVFPTSLKYSLLREVEVLTDFQEENVLLSEWKSLTSGLIEELKSRGVTRVLVRLSRLKAVSSPVDLDLDDDLFLTRFYVINLDLVAGEVLEQESEDVLIEPTQFVDNSQLEAPSFDLNSSDFNLRGEERVGEVYELIDSMGLDEDFFLDYGNRPKVERKVRTYDSSYLENQIGGGVLNAFED